jgi:hypothetical protein
VTGDNSNYFYFAAVNSLYYEVIKIDITDTPPTKVWTKNFTDKETRAIVVNNGDAGHIVLGLKDTFNSNGWIKLYDATPAGGPTEVGSYAPATFQNVMSYHRGLNLLLFGKRG